ncbi:hypothetical protein DIS24_g7179 [Lasiodiplodia hormozganensis]|uniref:Uncharacterized protein n=1 Tax=Lasiodiplodia hormozganensis TaxID=869390 RepID=A0AA39YCD0_9PEZI|nr:hypothetical protein DIS24_g7179 [Lasiodiplodia hormozganensis]
MATVSPLLHAGPATAFDMTVSDPRPAPASRKRSRSMIFEEEKEYEEHWGGRTDGRASDSPDESSGLEDLKRTRTTSDLDALGVVPASEAWQLQSVATDLLTSADAAVPNALKHYVAGRSPIVLCVLEHVDIHYQLLCAALPALHARFPTAQPLLLTRSPSYALPHLSPTPPPFPILPAQGYPHNHYLKLGLLHPLGGGQAAMDALVVLDARGRRRLVLPFGWGAGRHVGEAVGGREVQERLMAILGEALQELECESG